MNTNLWKWKLLNGTDMLEVDPASSEEKSEKGETSSDELNQLRAQEHSTTGTPNKDSLETEEHESLISNNIE